MKKLQLKKEVVSRLNDDRMNQVKGGTAITATEINCGYTHPCATYPKDQCPQSSEVIDKCPHPIETFVCPIKL